MRTMDKIGQVMINLLIGLIIIVAAFTLYSYVALEVLDKDYVSLFGYTYFEVASGSMTPTINKEDMVIVKLNSDYKQEDIVTYNLNGDFITHRVKRIDTSTVTTKGDANNTKDAPISKDSILGKVVCIIPNFGIWKRVLLSPRVLILLIITFTLFSFTFSYNTKAKRKKLKRQREKKQLEKQIITPIKINEEVEQKKEIKKDKEE
ncbi:MAG: signal peptidase I [Erysipelotrichaceae bacterium]|nr:signal peptidase I [Erysipelotrichaceae bacterium]